MSSSQNNSPQKHGFCNAIFSTSPFNSQIENCSPNPKHDDKYKYSCLKNDFFKPQKLPSVKPKRGKVANNVHLDRVIASSTPELHKSQPEMSEKTSLSKKVSVSEEKLKTPVRNGNRDRDNFFTPRRPVSSTSKTPTKKYFSDFVQPQTPDCFNVVQMETPKAKDDEPTIYEGESTNLMVGIRVRPLNMKELVEKKVTSIVSVSGQNIIVDCDSTQHTFSYDHCFVSYSDQNVPGHASQETVFNNLALPMVDHAFDGYNVCLFAYGQTGSGKSYSMMGTEQPNSSQLHVEAGIIPRFCHQLFTRIQQNSHLTTTVEISYFEIYNEKIHDLLINSSNSNNQQKKPPLKVREHPTWGPYVVDLSQHVVQNYEDLKTWLKVGNSQRATAATGMNEKSSRSHSIFSIILTQVENDPKGEEGKDASRRSKINLVDLAGSERLSHTGVTGSRLREGVSINKSLLTLGKVIGSLAENTNNRKRGFVPYRESVLTWLLKESLGGNSRTAMLGTVSPASTNLEETLATLRYACQARAIVNRIHINEDQHDRLIRSLQARVSRLEELREGYERQLGLTPRRLLDSLDASVHPAKEMQCKQHEIESLKDQLKTMEQQFATNQKSWQQKLKEAEEKKNSELKYLRRCGIAIELDFRQQTQSCLMNLTADPMLSGTLLYLLPKGTVRIGKRSANSSTPTKRPDIVLDGPLVRPSHCVIENKDGKLYLHPEQDGDTFVNGKKIYRRVQLRNGDRLIIGGSHYFKVIHPQDDRELENFTQPIDFEYAHEEVLRVQEKELRTELEESKQKAMKELENAKQEMEAQFNSQKTVYEKEIKALGTTLEKQKSALEDINRKQEKFEQEKELLIREIETNKRIKSLQQENKTELSISPYKSNFLQEIEKILNETTAGAEIALTLKSSNQAMKAGGVSLYELQLLVREASERCRELGLNYEFCQQQIVKDKTLESVVRVRDRDQQAEVFWKPMRFLDWVHRLRDHDVENSIKELAECEEDWQPYEQVSRDSLESRISVNITPVKKQLNESIFQMSLDSSMMDMSLSEIDKTAEVSDRRHDDMIQCLRQMEIAAKTLAKLCNRHLNSELSNKVSTNLDQVYKSAESIKVVISNATNDSKTESSGNETVIEAPTGEKKEKSVVASNKKFFEEIDNKKNKCPFAKSETPKSVRFNFS